MPTLTATPAAYLISEANGTRSRDTVTLAAGQNLTAGAVLGRITASGHHTQLDPTASDGSEAAAAILFAPVDATTATAAVVTSRDAEVHAAALFWPTGITTEQQAAATAQLAALGIVAR